MEKTAPATTMRRDRGSGRELPFTGRTPWPRRLDTPLRTFLRTETGSAGMLLLATAAALVWTNIDAASYERVWRTRLALAIGHAGVSHDLLGAAGWLALSMSGVDPIVIGLAIGLVTFAASAARGNLERAS